MLTGTRSNYEIKFRNSVSLAVREDDLSLLDDDPLLEEVGVRFFGRDLSAFPGERGFLGDLLPRFLGRDLDDRS